jgi:hypothetical protein
VETDILLAHVKERDWLKPYAEALLKAAEKGEVELYASCARRVFILAKNMVRLEIKMAKIVKVDK